MLTCARLAANAALGSCRNGNGAISGEVIAINFDDWQNATITEAKGVISSIVLADQAGADRLTSKDRAFEASYTMNRGTYSNSLIHQVILRAFDNTQENKAAINALIQGRFVFIVKRVDVSNPGTVYEVYGRQNGLTASASEGNSTDGDGVLNTTTMASDDNARESEIPTSVFSTDLATTKTMIDALVAA